MRYMIGSRSCILAAAMSTFARNTFLPVPVFAGPHIAERLQVLFYAASCGKD